jgi:hypothetical protein
MAQGGVEGGPGGRLDRAFGPQQRSSGPHLGVVGLRVLEESLVVPAEDHQIGVDAVQIGVDVGPIRF